MNKKKSSKEKRLQKSVSVLWQYNPFFCFPFQTEDILCFLSPSQISFIIATSEEVKSTN